MDRDRPVPGDRTAPDVPAPVQPMAERFAELASFQRSRAPFSAALCDAIAQRPRLADLLALAPEQQQLPVLVLAAIHESVLADPACELAAWYPDIVSRPRTDDVGAALEAHMTQRWDDLAHSVTTRAVQTNEVGRCALLWTAIASIDAPATGIGLIDVGTSAGLNLWMDHYRYEFRLEDGSEHSIGPDSTVSLTIDVAGSVPIPSGLPSVRHRIGIDTSPISLDDERSVRWLRACIWPDQIDRIERFDAAAGLARGGSVDLREADAVDGIADAVDALGDDVHPVVMHSWVLNYLTPERRRAFAAELDRVGRERDLSWVFAEAPDETPELPHPAGSADLALTAVNTVTWRDGGRSVRHLGMAHPHGYWLRAPDAAHRPER